MGMTHQERNAKIAHLSDRRRELQAEIDDINNEIKEILSDADESAVHRSHGDR